LKKKQHRTAPLTALSLDFRKGLDAFDEVALLGPKKNGSRSMPDKSLGLA
jgi:hypothetical protein